MYTFAAKWIEFTKDANVISTKTLADIKNAIPQLPSGDVTFMIHPTPKWSLLNAPGPLSFMYDRFTNIDTVIADDIETFNALKERRIQSNNSSWYLLEYSPTDGSTTLKSSNVK
jgi:hypothetical protein